MSTNFLRISETVMDGNFEQIADLCCGGGASKTSRLVPVAEALERATALAKSVPGTEVLGLSQAVGRVLAQDIVAPFPLPPFDNSAMDGYAVRSEDCLGPSPIRLTVAGRIAAGDDARKVGRLKPGHAIRIFTGAAVPEGADAVIMQEHVNRQGDVIEINARHAEAVSAGSCIRRKGEDATQGAEVLQRGRLLAAREIGAIASLGFAEVTVQRRVRIALFCTGSELRQPGQSLGPGQIYNSNRFMLLSALQLPWIEVLDLGAVPDDPDRLRATLIEAAQNVDMVITTGGVSVGEEDHMVEQLRSAGGWIEVMKIAMKPGKPLSIGMLNEAVYVGLPGNPVAAYTTWQILGARIAEKLSGQTDPCRAMLKVEAVKGFGRHPGRQEFRPAKIVGVSSDGRPQVHLLDHSFSAKISLICKADGFAIIPMNCEQVMPGDALDFVQL